MGVPFMLRCKVHVFQEGARTVAVLKLLFIVEEGDISIVLLSTVPTIRISQNTDEVVQVLFLAKLSDVPSCDAETGRHLLRMISL